MIKTGYVTETNGEIARIRIYRESACGENCAHCKGCKNGEFIVEAENTINAAAGESVRIIMDNKSFFKSALLGYGLLVFALVFGGVLGYALFKSDFLSAAFAFLFTAVTLLIYKIGFKNKKPNIKIERI